MSPRAGSVPRASQAQHVSWGQISHSSSPHLLKSSSANLPVPPPMHISATQCWESLQHAALSVHQPFEMITPGPGLCCLCQILGKRKKMRARGGGKCEVLIDHRMEVPHGSCFCAEYLRSLFGPMQPECFYSYLFCFPEIKGENHCEEQQRLPRSGAVYKGAKRSFHQYTQSKSPGGEVGADSHRKVELPLRSRGWGSI